jgi:hypothetical protein
MAGMGRTLGMGENYVHEWPAEWEAIDIERDEFLSEEKADMREEFYDKQSDHRAKVAKFEFDARISRCEAEKKKDDARRSAKELRWPVPLPPYVLQTAREFNHSCKQVYLTTTDDKIKKFFMETEQRVVRRFATQAFTEVELWYMYQRLIVDCKWVHTWIDYRCTENVFQDVCGASSKLIAAIHRALHKQAKNPTTCNSNDITQMYYLSDSSEEMSECQDNDDMSDNDTYDTKVEWKGVWVQWKHGKWGQVEPPHEKAA